MDMSPSLSPRSHPLAPVLGRSAGSISPSTGLYSLALDHPSPGSCPLATVLHHFSRPQSMVMSPSSSPRSHPLAPVLGHSAGSISPSTGLYSLALDHPSPGSRPMATVLHHISRPQSMVMSPSSRPRSHPLAPVLGHSAGSISPSTGLYSLALDHPSPGSRPLAIVLHHFSRPQFMVMSPSFSPRSHPLAPVLGHVP